MAKLRTIRKILKGDSSARVFNTAASKPPPHVWREAATAQNHTNNYGGSSGVSGELPELLLYSERLHVIRAPEALVPAGYFFFWALQRPAVWADVLRVVATMRVSARQPQL